MRITWSALHRNDKIRDYITVHRLASWKNDVNRLQYKSLGEYKRLKQAGLLFIFYDVIIKRFIGISITFLFLEQPPNFVGCRLQRYVNPIMWNIVVQRETKTKDKRSKLPYTLDLHLFTVFSKQLNEDRQLAFTFSWSLFLSHIAVKCYHSSRIVRFLLFSAICHAWWRHA